MRAGRNVGIGTGTRRDFRGETTAGADPGARRFIEALEVRGGVGWFKKESKI